MRIKTLQLKKTTFAVLVGLLLSVAGVTKAFAQTFTVGNLNYSVNDDGVSVTVTGHVDGTNATGELVIPESVEYYGTSFPVTVIGESAFYGCTGLIGTLNLPESITIIGASAFGYCSGFSGSLTIPNYVTLIGQEAFSYCTGFSEELTIGSSLALTGYGVFNGCSGFTTLNYNAVNCDLMKIRLVGSELLIILSGDVYGGYYTYYNYSLRFHWLYGCNSLTTLNIGENVEKIPSCFVDGCSNLTGTLAIPESVSFVGNSAFNDCSGFTGSLSIPNSITNIDANAFKNCTGFTNLTGAQALTTIGENAFEGCSGFMGSFTIPNSVITIGSQAFQNCSGFSGTLTLGNSVTQIGNSAFFGACEGFTSFNVLPIEPPTLGNNVFVSMNYSLPVQVSCGSLQAYQNAEGWNVFTNIQEPNLCMWEISATVNPSSGGTVSGAGTYEQGQTCTLTATPNEGYEFLNWKENDIVVSTETTYSFTVVGNRTLTAYFRLPPDPVGTVVAEYYPDSENPESPYVKLHWNGGIESFETGDFSMYDWQLNPTYPWQISNNNPYEGSFCMRSGGSGVGNVTSNMILVVDYSVEGTISFFSKTTSESNFDYGHFYIDGQEMGNWSGETNWEEHSYTIAAGSHTFQWSYTKDGSANVGDDCFYVDNISFDNIGISHYCVYRTECANGNFLLLADNVTTVSYIDNSWLQLAIGSYQYGICGVYYDGTTSPMKISSCIEKHANVSVTITAIPNYEERGIIGGAGDYVQGETCSLTATANEGFEFRHWTENGQVVSTEAQYSFTVSNARNLTAIFSTPAIVFADANVEAICVNNWDTDGDGSLCYDEAAAVTSIGETFRNHDEITSFDELQYFTGLTSIGYYAFMNCTNLISVVIPEGVTQLDYKAFAYSGITEITIPESLTSTNNVVFEGCEALTVMNYNAINCTRVAEYSYSWLTGCNSLTTLNIGENVQSIPWGAFRGCSSLTGELNIPESVISIASDAFANTSFTTINFNATNCTYQNAYYNHGVFQDCNAPATLHIGENVKTIPDCLFSGHSGLVGELVIPNSVTSIGENAFAGCSGLTGTLYIPNTVVSIGVAAFYGCSGFTGALNIPTTLTRIEDGVFQECSGFTGSLSIPNTIAYIGGWAFGGCTGLDGTLTISASVQEVGSNAFSNTGFTTLNYNAVNCQFGYYYNGGNWFEYYPAISDCPSLTTLNICEGVESISIMAFKDLANFTGTLTLPNSLKSIGDQAFYNCYGLEGIEMGNGVETIGTEAFRNCGGLRGELTLPETLQSVGNYAFASCDELTTINYNAINCTAMGNAQSPVFYDCASMAHINIGENVESIPNYAFKRCSTVTDMTVAATVPPTVGSSTFGTLQRSIPVTVQCEATAAYQAAQYWNEFTNYNEGFNYVLEVTCDPERGTVVVNKMADCDDPTARVTAYPEIGYAFLGWSENGTLVSEANPYTFTMESSRELQAEFIPGVSYSVTVTVVPAAAGTVTGQGNYNDGSAVTLTATTNPGYAFVNWTENGSVVSTDEEYTFTIHANRNLVANFTPYAYHWDVNIHQYPGNMTAIGVIQIDGVEQTTPTLEIGAFCNDECRGRQLLTYYPQVDRYMVFLMLYGEDGDEMSFKLYDHVLEQELTLSCTSLVTFAANTALGNPVNPYVFNFINSQQTPLAEGWTWYSTYIEQEDIEGLQIMTEALNESGVMIKSQTGFIANSGGQWMGNLDEITNESMYMVNTTAATLLDMVGNSAIASQHPITMNSGWNWIGYPMATANSVSVALSDLEAQPNDVLKSQESFATYYEGIGWFGSLNTIIPGMGLMYDSKNSSPVTFTYSEGRSGMLKRNVTADNNHWVPDMHKYTNNMNVMAVVELDDVELRDSRYELAVFAGNECRGSVRLVYVEPIDRYVAFLTVAGRETTDLHFALFDEDANTEYGDAKESLVFESDAVVGDTKNMMSIHFASRDQECNWGALSLYPNPTEGGEYFNVMLPAGNDQKVRVEVVNELGAMVSVTQSGSLPMEVKAPTTPGLYIVKIIADGHDVCFRKLVVK